MANLFRGLQRVFGGDPLETVTPDAVTKLTQAAMKRQEEEQKNKQLLEKTLQEQLEAGELGIEQAKKLGIVSQAMATQEGALARQQVRGGPRGATSGFGAASAARIAAGAAEQRRKAKVLADERLQQARKEQIETKKKVATERQQLLKTEAALEVATAQALEDAKGVFQQAVDDTLIFFTDADRNKAAQAIRDTVLPGASAATIAAVEKYIKNTVLNPEHDVSWRVG